MDKYPFISQSGRKEVDRNTQRQIRTYAMVNHLKQKAEAKSAHATASHFAPIHAGHQPLKSRRENTTSTLKNTRPCSEKTRDRFVTTEGYIVANKRQQASTNNDSKMSLGDVAVYCGSYPFEGIPHELSRQVSFALMFHFNSHVLDHPLLKLGLHPLFSHCLMSKFFNNRATFFAMTLKVLLFNALEGPFREESWLRQHNVLYLRAKALEALSQEIQLSKTVLDTTIVATGTLIMFEATLGSTHESIHLKGLHQMMHQKPRGRRDSDFLKTAEWLHTTKAILCNRSNYFDEPYEAASLPTAQKPSEQEGSSRSQLKGIWLFCPLLANSDESAPPAWLSSQTLHLLENASELTFLLYSEGDSPPSGRMGSRSGWDDHQNQSDCDTPEGPATSFQDPQSHGFTKANIHEACRLAASMHQRAIHGDKCHSLDLLNRKESRHLWTTLKGAPLSSWVSMPYVYLWVLLTGAASSSTPPGETIDMKQLIPNMTQGFFFARLCQFQMTIGLRWWQESKAVLDSFSSLQSKLRHSNFTQSMSRNHGIE